MNVKNVIIFITIFSAMFLGFFVFANIGNEMQLNLSHITCGEGSGQDSKAEVHFVVVHIPENTQDFGQVAYTINGTSRIANFDKLTGSTAHYLDYIPNTTVVYEVSAGSVVIDEKIIYLNNPTVVSLSCEDPTPTPTPSESPTSTPTPEPSHTPEPTPAPEPTPTPEPSHTPTPSPTPTPSLTPTPTPSGSPTPTPTPSESPTPTPIPSPTSSPTPTPTSTPNPSCTGNCGGGGGGGGGGSPEISIQKLGRDVTKNEIVAGNSLATAPANLVEFTIILNALSPTNFSNVNLRDILPSQFTYIGGSAKINGQSVSDGIASSSGILVPNVTPTQPATIKFLASVIAENGFQIGTTNLVNVARIQYSGVTKEASLPITVQKGQVLGTSTIAKVAGIKTGFDNWLLAFISGLLFANGYLAYIQTGYGRKRILLGLIQRQSRDKGKFNFIQ